MVGFLEFSWTHYKCDPFSEYAAYPFPWFSALFVASYCALSLHLCSTHLCAFEVKDILMKTHILCLHLLHITCKLFCPCRLSFSDSGFLKCESPKFYLRSFPPSFQDDKNGLLHDMLFKSMISWQAWGRLRSASICAFVFSLWANNS